MRATRGLTAAAITALLAFGSSALAQDGHLVLVEHDGGASASFYGYDGRVDWNADGAPDFLVANDDRVSVSVVSGRTGLALATFTDFGGGTVLNTAFAPDMTGDGERDIIVGLTRGGKSTAPPPVVQLINGETGEVVWESAGNAPVEFFGSDVEALGDVNGDQTPDVLAAGFLVARVLSGKDGTRLYEFNSTGVCCPSDSVTVLGDIDGDDVDDFVIGSSRYSGEFFGDDGPDQGGRALIVSGATGQEIESHRGKRDIALVGLEIAAPGDVDQDDVPDYAVGANIVKGKTFNPGFTIYSGRSHRKIGIVPAALVPGAKGLRLLSPAPGDVDRDGLPDYLIHVTTEDGEYVAILAGSPSRGPILFRYDRPENEFFSSFGIAGDLSEPRDGIPDLIVGLTESNVVRVIEVRVLPFVPGNLKNALAFARDPAIEEQVSARLLVAVKKGAQSLTIFTDGLVGAGVGGKAATGPFGVFLEDGVDAGAFHSVGTLGGDGVYEAFATGTVPPQLGVTSLADLVGRRVQIRDGAGAALLETIVPALVKQKKGKTKGTLTPASAQFPDAKLKLKAAFNPKTGALDLKAKVKKAGEGPFVFELETSAGSGVFEEIARIESSKLKISTGTGAPLAGAFTVADLVGRSVRVYSGETLVLEGRL